MARAAAIIKKVIKIPIEDPSASGTAVACAPFSVLGSFVLGPLGPRKSFSVPATVALLFATSGLLCCEVSGEPLLK